MSPMTSEQDCEVVRQMLFLSEPSLWPAWPVLPLIRRRPGCDEECGFLLDGDEANGRNGFTSTVFLGNIFEMPARHEDLLELPREAYDNAEAIYAADWRIE